MGTRNLWNFRFSIIWTILFIFCVERGNADLPWGNELIIVKPNDFNISSRIDSGKITVTIREELSTPTDDAIEIQYLGDLEDSITATSEYAEYECFAQKINEKWFLVFSKTPDYDNSTTKPLAVQITLTAGSSRTSLYASLFNIDDNPPVVTPKPVNNCTIQENSHGPVGTCLFDVSDKDGCVGQTTFQFFASGEASQLFSMELPPSDSTYPGCLQSETISRSASGTLQVLSDLDFEKTLSYFLTFKYSNGIYNNLDSSLPTILNVVDMPDELPKWTSVTPTVTVDEEKIAEFKIEAKDGDAQINADICYNLKMVDDDVPLDPIEEEYFSIDKTSGMVSIAGIDRDRFQRNTYNLMLFALECENDTSVINQTTMLLVKDSFNKDLNYTITDANSTAYHDFPEQSFPENTVFQLNCTVLVTDPDEGNAGTFKAYLEGPESFVVLPTRAFQSGEFTIQSTAMMDYENETLRELSLTLIVEEIQNSTHRISLPITVSITNENDESPVFKNTENYALHLSIRENVQPGQELGTIEATDADGDPIKYGLVNTNDLEIDENSGLITIKDAVFDHERSEQMQYQVSAYDGIHTTYIPLMVDIEDVNDTPPNINVVSKSAIPVEENAVAESEVPNVDVQVLDSDSDYLLTVDIDWDLSSGFKDYQPVDVAKYRDWFKIALPDVTSGKLALIVGSGLDWTVADNLQLAIVVTDENTKENNSSSTALLNVLIKDVNDKAPQFLAGICENLSDSFKMSERSDVGVIVGTVRATDDDGPGNNVIQYSYSDPSNLCIISVEESTGVVTTGAGANAVDYETDTSVTVVITASDGVDSHLASCNLAIKVLDVNDNIPVGVPKPDPAIVNITEDTIDGTLVTIQGLDDDSTDAFKTITYIMRGDIGYQDLFVLTDHGDNTAEVAVKVANDFQFDYESDVKQYHLSVILTDNPSDINHQQSSTTTITVNILDVNDNFPIFTSVPPSDTCLFSVKEDFPQDVLLTAKIQAKDKDSGENGRISYSIANVECVPNTNNVCPTDRKDLFTLVEDTAEVKSSVNLLGKFGKFDVEVMAKDHGDPSKSTPQKYYFCVEDINDHSPVFVYPDDSISKISIKFDENGLLLNGETGGPLSNFKVTDEDFGVNAQVTWAITPPEVFSLQALADNEAILHVVGNSDNLQRTTVTLTACDSPAAGNPFCSTKEVEIVPKQIKAVEPVFDVSIFDTNFQEASTTELITIPIATDANNDGVDDPTQIERIYYYITSTEPEGNVTFSLDKDTRELRVLTALDATVCDQYNITVQASNQPDPNSLPRPSDQSILIVNVSVEDINDKVPEFSRGGKYILSMTSSDAGKIILTVDAKDPDKNDAVRYQLIKDSIEMNIDNDGGIDKGSVFSLDETNGNLKVDKYPTTSTSGFFAFNVTATDGFGSLKGGDVHNTTAGVTIYIITDQYLIPAVFHNTQAQVAAYTNEFVKMVQDAYNTTCIPGQLSTEDPYTTLFVYFLDGSGKPIKPNEMAVLLNDYNTSHVLQRDALTRYGLDLNKFGVDVSSKGSTEDSINTALIAVCAVLAALLIGSAIFYFIKTRRMTNLLNRLTNAASDDTSDKKGLALPNTNMHTQEGANPVWNTEVAPDFDRVSTTSSDDSGLIGIEDNPEFQSFYNQVVLKAKQVEHSNNDDLMRENPQLRGLTLDDEMRY